ncbi:peptidoglycan-binding protein [Catellatospora citrea]|uniref:Peptidoglycan-binding protein n=1 Tax=Catellatospora citrea TaxID=53366 RepID=A0A8J3K750_9ACTN|nr:peptidoglycan-binding protein [Catellatospora citrea]RKE10177.1 multidrug efflux pump subunit AcrA (membrane-fusion protein) [Catellatospora citrea]GIF97911.1 peptidoglycan-binding protein [Catellatospora citrea]
MSGRWRRVLFGVVAAAVVAAAAAMSAGVFTGGGDDSPVGAPTVDTVKVTRTTITAAKVVEGEIGYGQPAAVTSKAVGTLTWLAAVGSTVQRGRPLLRADNNPVVLLYGELPFYRLLADGVKGPDVAQLETNLAALKYTGFETDTSYSASTAAAVKRWQKDLGLPVTGTVAPTDVIVAPGALRIAAHTARLGAPAAGDVVTAGPTTLVVTAKVPAAEPDLAKKGVKATVTLPDGAPAEATVLGVVTPVDGASGGQTPEQGPPTVTVQLALKAGTEPEPGTVRVRFVTAEHADVLVVPIQALVAVGERGYGVEVRDGATSRIVPVQTGLFAGGKVEISGDGIAEGVTVGVAQ